MSAGQRQADLKVRLYEGNMKRQADLKVRLYEGKM
jgi:hypothetical protein